MDTYMERLSERTNIYDRMVAASNEVSNLSSGKRQWTMWIPAHETNSDVVIGAALDDIKSLLIQVKNLQEQNDVLRDAIAEMLGEVAIANNVPDKLYTLLRKIAESATSRG